MGDGPGFLEKLLRPLIAELVVALPRRAAQEQDAVGSQLKRLEDEARV
jgi:hypothetical protein